VADEVDSTLSPSLLACRLVGHTTKRDDPLLAYSRGGKEREGERGREAQQSEDNRQSPFTVAALWLFGA